MDIFKSKITFVIFRHNTFKITHETEYNDTLTINISFLHAQAQNVHKSQNMNAELFNNMYLKNTNKIKNKTL